MYVQRVNQTAVAQLKFWYISIEKSIIEQFNRLECIIYYSISGFLYSTNVQWTLEHTFEIFVEHDSRKISAIAETELLYLLLVIYLDVECRNEMRLHNWCSARLGIYLRYRVTSRARVMTSWGDWWSDSDTFVTRSLVTTAPSVC